jgi:hypothetical protein
VSPAATADTIGGVVLVLMSGPGQVAEAAPPEMHARGEGLGAGVGVACELPPPPEEPHAASNIAIATIARIFVPATGAGLRSAPVALKGFMCWAREAEVAAPSVTRGNSMLTFAHQLSPIGRSSGQGVKARRSRAERKPISRPPSVTGMCRTRCLTIMVAASAASLLASMVSGS